MADPVLDYLGSHSLLTLATASKNGIPHAAPVIYVNDGTTVYFSIAPSSTSASNLAENPVAAIGVADNPDDWNAAQGAQLVGNVAKLSGDDAKKAAGLFTQRFSNLGDAVDSAPFYRLQPHDVRYVDNKSSSGEKSEALGQSWVTNVVHRVFRHLRPDEVDSLSKKFSKESFKSGTTMIEQGTAGDRFYLIVDGVARTTNAQGQELSTSGPGGFVGEIAILADRPRTATVTAATDVNALSLSKADFESVMQASPDLRRDFDVVVAERLARAADLTAAALEQDVSESVARAPKGRVPATLAVLLLALVIIGSAVAFSIPNRTPRPDGGAALTRYLPLIDGDAALSTRVDASGGASGWEAANTDVLGDGEALLSLTVTTFTQLTTLYGSAEKDPVPPGMKHATVRIERVTTIDPTGAIVANGQRSNVITRDASGDRLLTVTDANGELAFDPPALILPTDLEVGKEWSTTGNAGAQPFTVKGKVIERAEADGFKDCLRFEVSSVVGEATARSQNLACSGIGVVERDDLDDDGELIQHIDLLTSGTTQLGDDLPGPPAPAAEPPAPEGAITLGRVGKATPTGSISPPTFTATFVASDPPSVLVASERGDLVALAAETPDVVQWRFHPGGSMYGAPGVDPSTGWLYAGATDKRLYALDGRGYFLWSVQADDNVATRPVIARGIVAFATEAGTAFGIDATTGAERWKRDLRAPAVASPAVVDDTVIFGNDQGTIQAVDIDDGGGRWSHTADGSVEAAITTDSAGIAYVADAGGGIRAIDATTGRIVWHVTKNDSFRTSAVATSGLVVVVGESGAIYAVDAEDGGDAWQSTGDFVGPVAETDGAVVAVRAGGFLDEIGSDGTLINELAAQDASAPGDPAPDYRLGVTSGGDAVWSVDESTIVRRIGPGSGGLTALQAVWVHTFTEAPFSGAGFPATVGEFQGRAVVIDAGGAVYLIDPKTGDPERIGDDPDSQVAAGTAAVVDGSQVFMTLGGALRAVDLPSGNERWNDGQTGTVLNPPVVVGDVVVVQRAVTLDDGTFVSEVVAHDRVTGEERWTRRLSPAGSGPTAAGDLIIAGSPLTALDARDGSIVWQVEPDRSVVGAPGFDAEEGLVVAALRTGGQSFTQDLVAVDAATGEERWRTPIDGAPEFTEAVSVHDGLVVVPEVGLPVVGFDEATGTEEWRFTPPPPGRHLGTATIENGQVWLLSSNGRVFVLDATNGEVVAQSSGLPNDVGSFFAPWGMQVRSVGGVFIAPMAVILSAFDPPEGP